jgi:hypothetical protein
MCYHFGGKKIIPHFYILGNRRISITVQWCGYVGWQLNFFNYLKRHGREGHEMAIKTRVRGKNKEEEWKKRGEETKITMGRYWQD